MSNWGILDDNSVSANGDVEYVGMSNDDGVPVRVPRRPVRRASQASIPAYSRPAPSPRHPLKPSKDNLYHLPTATGDSVAMNDEAIQNMRSGGVHDIGGRAARRVQPGTYITYGPDRGPSGHLGVGMGGMGTDDDDDDNGDSGGFDVGGMFESILTGGAALVSSITGGVATIREQRTSAELAAEGLRLEDEAARESRYIAERENVRAHQLRLADIRLQQEELVELRRTQAQLEEEQAQYDATTLTLPVNGAGGVSPVVWVLLAMVGVGGIGAFVWLLTKDKDEESKG